MNRMYNAWLINPFILPCISAFSLIFIITSCASPAASKSAKTDDSSATESTAESQPAAQVQPQGEHADAGQPATPSSQPAGTGERISEIISEPCKQQDFVEYEKQSQAHIRHGWEATQAQRFGVGFRNEGEYQKWQEMHSKLFAKVSDACNQLTNCTKQKSSAKENNCISEAKQFEQWQALAKRFVGKVKIVEHSQPPMLCSFTPVADDPSQCYALVADKIEQTCQTQQCTEAANCFRGVSFLDDAINQAKLACGFAGSDLAQCRGYVEATARRKTEFEQCLDLYVHLPMEILPVI